MVSMNGPSKILSHIDSRLYQNTMVHDVCKIKAGNVGTSTHDLYTQMLGNPYHKKLVLGGDHSLALGSIASIKKTYPNSLILWIDAHADLKHSTYKFIW